MRHQESVNARRIPFDVLRYYTKDCSSVNPSLVKIAEGLRRSRDVPGLADITRHFDSASHTIEDFAYLRQVRAFFKKNVAFAHGKACQAAAMNTFVEGERACAATNRRLKQYVGYPDKVPGEYHDKILFMQRWISDVLGEASHFVAALPSLIRVTSGATSTSRRKDSLPQLKMRLKLHCTSGARKYLASIYHLYGFRPPKFRVVRSNRVQLVRKNWSTDRTIACEPEGNLPLQLAFDTYAKRRLRLYGINLSDQSLNQRLARDGSINDTNATIDFSNASGTVAYNTVHLLFQVDWFRFLADVRSPAYRFKAGDGQETYSMFSSMGNGSTFCIETLIFAAAAKACGSKVVSVYGDDVVIDPECYDDYRALTAFLGFTIGAEKSFTKGPFRESCGTDWYLGRNVTPKYIVEVDERKALKCHFINSMLTVAKPYGSLSRYLLSLVNKWELPLVPYNESSISGIWIEPDVARKLGILKSKYTSTVAATDPNWAESKTEPGQRWPSKELKQSFRFVDTFKSYIPKTDIRKFNDIRGYYLWFLAKTGQVRYSPPFFGSHAEVVAQVKNMGFENDLTSGATLFGHSYVRKRVFWHQPKAVPDHLPWWSNYFAVLTLQGSVCTG